MCGHIIDRVGVRPDDDIRKIIKLLTGRESGKPFIPLSNSIQINNVIMIKLYSTGMSKIFNTITNINNMH